MSPLLTFLYPPPPSLFVTAMSAISFLSLANSGFSEVRGNHIQYSKFWNTGPAKKCREFMLSSRVGMFAVYAPAFVTAASSFFIPGVVVGARAQLVSAALSVHFFKRVSEDALSHQLKKLLQDRKFQPFACTDATTNIAHLGFADDLLLFSNAELSTIKYLTKLLHIFEVMFIHQYSGKMILDTTIQLSFSYCIITVTMIYAQYLTQDMAEPAIDLTYAGVGLFLIGISGNFYHHYLLSKLRKKDDKGYKIPKGGLFGQAICAHYLFEIIGFIGVTFISQTVYPLAFTLGSTFYLMGRSYATRKWYLSKFENFPTNVKALVPYIF